MSLLYHVGALAVLFSAAGFFVVASYLAFRHAKVLLNK